MPFGERPSSSGYLVEVEDAAGRDQAGERAHRERAAAESKQVDAVAGFVDSRELGIQLLDVATEAPPGRARDDAEPLVDLGANAVVVDRNLLGERWIGAVAVAVNRLEQLEDVRAAALDGGVSRAVGTDDDVLLHVRRRGAW